VIMVDPYPSIVGNPGSLEEDVAVDGKGRLHTAAHIAFSNTKTYFLTNCVARLLLPIRAYTLCLGRLIEAFSVGVLVSVLRRGDNSYAPLAHMSD